MLDFFSNLFGLLAQYTEATVAEKSNIIEFANDAAKKLFSEDILTRNISDFAPGELLESTSDRASSHTEREGKTLYVTMFRLSDYRVFTFLPERYEDEEDFDFIATINEAVKTPLATLSSAANVMLPIVEGTGDETLSKNLALIYRNYFKLLRLSNNITGFYEISRRSTRLNLRNVDLLALCGNLVGTVSLLTKERGVRIWYTTSLSTANVVADFDKIEYILLNLLSNSLNHTGIGDDITVSVVRAGEFYMITVTDTGTGIPSGMMPFIFEPRLRRKALNDLEGGLGMGLAYSRHLVTVHGGSMVLESRENMGTTVKFTLPANGPDAMLAESPVRYGEHGIAPVLTELSGMLPLDCFDAKYLD